MTAKSAVVMEAGSGTILYQKDKDMKLPPASVTKVMSLLLIFEELDKGNLKYSDKSDSQRARGFHGRVPGVLRTWRKPDSGHDA